MPAIIRITIVPTSWCSLFLDFSPPASFIRRPSRRGSSLLYVIASLVVLSALGAGMASMTAGAFMAQPTENAGKRAYYLALSGVNYAQALPFDEFKDLAGKTTTLSMGGAGQAAVTVTGPDAAGDYAIDSLGTSEPGSSLEGNFTLAAARAGSEEISFADNLDDFGAPVESNPPDDIITVDLAAQSINFGNNSKETYGAIWYEGNSSAGSCQNGKCLFGDGFRAYFQLSFDPSTAGYGATGDGIVFAVINAQENDATRSGGDVNMGELIGYAGPGKTADGRGLIPPKIGVEFDIYNNSGDGDPDHAGSRRDGGSRDHVAYVYWGFDETDNACELDGSEYLCPYDDNRHSRIERSGHRTNYSYVGTGENGDQPRNSVSGESAYRAGYYAPTKGENKWLRNGAHAFRMEVSRAKTPDADGNYAYNLKSWVDCSNCDDVLTDYAAATPTLNSTIALNAANHAKFERFLFGWTMGTGDATQQAPVSNFKLSFK